MPQFQAEAVRKNPEDVADQMLACMKTAQKFIKPDDLNFFCCPEFGLNGGETHGIRYNHKWYTANASARFPVPRDAVHRIVKRLKPQLSENDVLLLGAVVDLGKNHFINAGLLLRKNSALELQQKQGVGGIDGFAPAYGDRTSHPTILTGTNLKAFTFSKPNDGPPVVAQVVLCSDVFRPRKTGQADIILHPSSGSPLTELENPHDTENSLLFAVDGQDIGPSPLRHPLHSMTGTWRASKINTFPELLYAQEAIQERWGNEAADAFSKVAEPMRKEKEQNRARVPHNLLYMREEPICTHRVSETMHIVDFGRFAIPSISKKRVRHKVRAFMDQHSAVQNRAKDVDYTKLVRALWASERRTSSLQR